MTIKEAKVGTRKTHFEDVGKRVDAHYIDGDVVVAHNGYERHKVYEKMKLLKCILWIIMNIDTRRHATKRYLW